MAQVNRSLPPRSVLITGASRGIGRAIALEYAASGVTLFLLGRDLARLESVAGEARALGACAEIRQADLGDRQRMRAVIEAADDLAPLDLVIANAGVASGTTHDGRHESWDQAHRTFDINVIGSLNTLAPAIDRMRARSRGRLAVMGSLAGRSAHPASPAYSASKAAVETYGLALRYSLARDGLSVSVISPGYVESDMSERVVGRKIGLISASRAARIIRRGLDADRAVISFPAALAFGAKLLTFLPDALRRRVVSRFSYSLETRD